MSPLDRVLSSSNGHSGHCEPTMEQSAPALSEILRHFAFDLPWLALFVLLAVPYSVAWSRLARTNPRVPHPRWKLFSWYAGILCLYIGILSPIEHYGNQLLWVSFTSFLFITMLAPPLLLWASPITLAFRVLGPTGRTRLRNATRTQAARLLTFLPIPWLLFAVVTYLWQFGTPADWAAESVWVRDLQQATLLLVALLFWFPALGADPLRWRANYPTRALYLLVEMTHKALFGAFFLSLSTPIHSGYAERLPAWGPSALEDQVMAIVVLWLGGNLVFLAAVAGLATRWIRQDAADGRRIDRRLARAREDERRRKEALQQVFNRPI